jgi:Cytochrome P460
MNAMRLNAMRWKFAARGLAVLWPITLAATIASQPTSPPPVQFPEGYRSWQHVKSIIIGPEHNSFAARGGIHHYYANKEALEGYRTGRFPNGSVIVDEGVLTMVDGPGQPKGIVLEGETRTLDVMVKDDRLYGDTGGWGFEHFEGREGQNAQTAKPSFDAKRRTACYECHSKRKDRDLVFSEIRVAKFTAKAPDAPGAPGTPK